MLRFNPSDIYRRSIEDDNQRMREEIESLQERLAASQALVQRLRTRIAEQHIEVEELRSRILDATV